MSDKGITRDEAAKQLDERIALYFAEYQQMGGQLDVQQYRVAVVEFLYHTFDIQVLGDPVRYESRSHAQRAFGDWLRKFAPTESVHRIFQSVDSVDAYT